MELKNEKSEWTFYDCTVEEEEENDLPVFVVTKQNGNVQRIYPATREDAEGCKQAMDDGESPIGWEDGLGHIVDAESGEHTLTIYSTGGNISEETRLYSNMEDAIEQVSEEMAASLSIRYVEIANDAGETATLWDAYYLMVEVSSWEHGKPEMVTYGRKKNDATVTYNYRCYGDSVRIVYNTSTKNAMDIQAGKEYTEPLTDFIEITTNNDWIVVMPPVSTAIVDKVIAQSGSSLTVAITPEARALGLDCGDTITVMLSRAGEDKKRYSGRVMERKKKER